jgi:hypothetical protein
MKLINLEGKKINSLTQNFINVIPILYDGILVCAQPDHHVDGQALHWSHGRGDVPVRALSVSGDCEINLLAGRS